MRDVSQGCPLWVKSGHWSVRQGCPLYPQKRTSCGEIGNQQSEYVVCHHLMPSRPALLGLVDQNGTGSTGIDTDRRLGWRPLPTCPHAVSIVRERRQTRGYPPCGAHLHDGMWRRIWGLNPDSKLRFQTPTPASDSRPRPRRPTPGHGAASRLWSAPSTAYASPNLNPCSTPEHLSSMYNSMPRMRLGLTSRAEN